MDIVFKNITSHANNIVKMCFLKDAKTRSPFNTVKFFDCDI